MPPAPFLANLALRESEKLDRARFPQSLPFLPGLDLPFENSVTFLVGENGSGKSTLLEAIADLCGLPVAGGGFNEVAAEGAEESRSDLSAYLRASFRRRPHAGYFFRAERQAHFATLLEKRREDPDFWGDPYRMYGGQSLHTRSHGEAFFEVFNAWMGPGILLMDEPEAALSPQRQLALLRQIFALNKRGNTQFIIATHSPILMTFPGASLYALEEKQIVVTQLEETSHFQITKGILENPEGYWRHLAREDESPRFEPSGAPVPKPPSTES